MYLEIDRQKEKQKDLKKVIINRPYSKCVRTVSTSSTDSFGQTIFFRINTNGESYKKIT